MYTIDYISTGGPVKESTFRHYTSIKSSEIDYYAF
jgi:hypothetical protein